MRNFVLAFVVTISFSSLHAQESQAGAWYMYFFNTKIGESNFGAQGDVQYRNWNLGGDMEQLMLRSGLTFEDPSLPVKFTLGYANITTGGYGIENTSTVNEHRVYQEALIPHFLNSKISLVHRFRYEQRWVENQDMRTRYRYNLFVNIYPFHQKTEGFQPYLALYNELFINGQREIGQGKTVEIFDRNRFYTAVGHPIRPGLKAQLGYMLQTTDSSEKGQLQLSLHHSF